MSAAKHVLFEVLTGGKPRGVSQAATAARVVLGTANIFAGAFDALEAMESGASFFEAAEKAWRKGQRRARALANVARDEE